jgi:hypothetical protein
MQIRASEGILIAAYRGNSIAPRKGPGQEERRGRDQRDKHSIIDASNSLPALTLQATLLYQSIHPQHRAALEVQTNFKLGAGRIGPSVLPHRLYAKREPRNGRRDSSRLALSVAGNIPRHLGHCRLPFGSQSVALSRITIPRGLPRKPNLDIL